MVRIAVTGANGFVGRHVVRAAVARGWSTVGLVRSDGAARQVREDGGQPFLLRDERVERALEGCEAVVHLAQVGAERGNASYEAVNVGFTDAVVRGARGAAVPRVVQFSGLGVARYGMKRRTTNGYFLSKLVAETLLMRSGLDYAVFRPSFVIGPGDAFVPATVRALERGAVERPGDGSYRMQPIAVADAAEAVLAAVARPAGSFPTVYDLVGPEPVTFAELLERLVSVACARGLSLELRVREVPVETADRRAREGGFQGMASDELDCLLCDEVSDPAPLVSLLGRALAPLDEALAAALRALALSRPSP